MAEEVNFFHWRLAYPEVFYEADGTARTDAGFDALAGNPPYVSSRNEQFYERLRPFIDERFDLATYQVDTYKLFVEITRELVQSEGFWAYIIPDSWMGDVTGESVREWLTNEQTPIKLGMPTQAVFHADVDCAVIVVKNTSEVTPTEVWSIWPDGQKIKRTVELNRSGEPFIISEAGEILDKVEKSSIPLEDIALTGRGIGPYHHSVHSEEVIENRAYHSDHKEDGTYRPELGGKNIDRYSIKWKGDRWISYGDWLAEPRKPELFEGPRVLCRKILSNRLCCTYVEDDWLVDQQVYVASQFDKGYEPQYATAILASSLMGYYTRAKYHEDTDLFPHIRVAQFRQLPVKKIDFQADTHSLTDFEPEFQDYLHTSNNISNVINMMRTELEANTKLVHRVLSYLVESMVEFVGRREDMNLNLLDYIKPYSEGRT